MARCCRINLNPLRPFITFPIMSFLIFCSCSATTNKLPSFPAILVFGDSTVDTGNNNYILTAFRSDHVPYGQDFPTHQPTGRFSNGRLSIDMLASALNITDLVPPFLDPNLSPSELRTGVSFASGGSGYDNITAPVLSIPVDEQLKIFDEYVKRLNESAGEDEAKRILSNALVVISAGSNDFALSYYDLPSRLFEYTVAGYQDFLQSKMQRAIKDLYDVGCRNMLITGLPPMGCLPIQMTLKTGEGRCIEEENDDAQMYNRKLIRQMDRMQRQLPGIKLSYADVYNPLLDMIQHPSKYGFEVMDVGCCGTGLLEAGPLCNLLSTACPDSTKYVFWDSIHPTETAYKYIVQSILKNSLAPFSS